MSKRTFFSVALSFSSFSGKVLSCMKRRLVFFLWMQLRSEMMHCHSCKISVIALHQKLEWFYLMFILFIKNDCFSLSYYLNFLKDQVKMMLCVSMVLVTNGCWQLDYILKKNFINKMLLLKVTFMFCALFSYFLCCPDFKRKWESREFLS